MAELNQAPAAEGAYPSTIERAAQVPQYVSALSTAAMVTLIAGVAVVTESVIVIVAMVALAMVAGLWGSVFGHGLGRAVMEHRVRAADATVARLREESGRQEADLVRVSHEIEALADEWAHMAPAIPERCVRQLRELLSIRMEDVR
ncbi:hypothetical protein [Microbispora sp. CA-102843]|uniref:hypothetical protein n=1 Tax=Microbispora sp. CA-102843 TaxID=3239952 RepID=UPI003D90007D